MSEFHRMITYLYLYEQGTKSRNVGFAKIERRDQRCFLEIHMKNTGCSLSPVPVYFYVQKDELLAGISLGNFSLTRGSGDFKTVLETKNFKESGYNIDDVKGIYIPLTAQIILVSQWDDDEFHRENFIDLSDASTEHAATPEDVPDKNNAAKGSSAQSIPAPNAPAENPSSDNHPAKNITPKDNPDGKLSPSPQNTPTENTNSSTLQAADDSKLSAASISPVSEPKTDMPMCETQTATNIPDKRSITPAHTTKNNSDMPAASPMPGRQDNSSVSQQDEERTPGKPKDALKAVEALPRSAEEGTAFRTIPGNRAQTSRQNPRYSQASRTNPNHAQTSENSQNSKHSQADAPEDWDLRWRFILENYPVMTPFAGDEHTLCVRMELKDLRQLPKQFWYLGNNSFLLHGFFNYRYFILGMTEEFGVRKWFVGVPGVFQNPERVMAALFGFPEFRSEKPSAINTGEFGYWYRYLNELSEPAKKHTHDQ